MITKLKIKDKKSKLLKSPYYLLPTTSYPLKEGQVMIIALVFLAVVLIIASSLFSRVTDFIRFGSNSVLKEQATNLADAGLDYATQRLNDLAGAYPDADGAGTDTQTLSTGKVVITVENKSQNLRTITATGYIPNQSSPRAKRTVKADVIIDSQQISFRYAVQTGEGGVSMANSSMINGTVYTNGSINGSGSSTINGEGYAHGTISSPDPTFNCEQLPCKHENTPEQPLPTIENPDINTLKQQAEAGGITNCTPTCTLDYNQPLTTERYNGNLSITNNATVTIMSGPIYITGNFTISQGGTILKLDNSFGSNGTYLIVDGVVTQTQGGQIRPTNANPKGYILLVTNSTSDSAISLSQSGTNAIFYALQGGADLSQSAEVTSLTAKKLTLQNSASLTYDQGLASATFSSGPGGGWIIKKGTYKFTSSP